LGGRNYFPGNFLGLHTPWCAGLILLILLLLFLRLLLNGLRIIGVRIGNGVLAVLVRGVVGVLARRRRKIALPNARILIRLLFNGRRIVGRILDLLGHGWGGKSRHYHR
jgi:hypothetical protein